MKIIIIPLLFIVLSACSGLPPTIANAPKPDVSLSQVDNNIDHHVAENIRWGGRVIKVENDNQGSTLHILAFPLNWYGQPDTDAENLGRFLVHKAEFLDPEVYKVNSLVTVSGVIKSKRDIQVDKKTLVLPIVELKDIYLWKYQDFATPYYSDPFYPYPYRFYGGWYGRYW